MVGADASLVLCYRDEYAKILGLAANQFAVQTVSEWLQGLDLRNITVLDNQETRHDYKLLAHCSEKTALPETEETWKKIFAQFGLTLNVTSVGCCGMAGTYGHELEHFNNSRGIYDLSWSMHAKMSTRSSSDGTAETTLDESSTHKNPQQILVTGYSCRSQVKRFEQYRPKHPIEVLAGMLK
jgi:Fe-S oxidoreductase